MRLALGTAQLGMAYGVSGPGRKVSTAEFSKILDFARVYGIDTLDTAAQYGDSETRLGDLGVTDFDIVTKLPSLPERTLDLFAWTRECLETSLTRLKCNSVRGVLIHNASDAAGDRGAELLSALASLVEEGLIKKIGVSVYGPSTLEQISDFSNISLVQGPFNLVDNRLIQSGWMERLASLGVEIHTRSVFLQGALLEDHRSLNRYFLEWSESFASFERFVNEWNVTKATACLSRPLSRCEVKKIVVGVHSLGQLKEIRSSVEWLSDDKNLKKLSGLWGLMAHTDPKLIDPRLWDF